MTCAEPGLYLRKQSVGIRESPQRSVVVVTQFVTHVHASAASCNVDLVFGPGAYE